MTVLDPLGSLMRPTERGRARMAEAADGADVRKYLLPELTVGRGAFLKILNGTVPLEQVRERTVLASPMHQKKKQKRLQRERER
ncbi:hypothetical protein C4D60_Mb10t15390 [Musa balbisiana]|uniref:Uncharacterized protein n=1 Tax=Musa balbisiana TaxID=52838 RepID=A0A4S8IZR8_MUSBA|nr:hypothetical protein C4D60_Mb10t15390 [Musa balbisiana]